MNDTCPVCNAPVHPVAGYRIPPHRDGLGHMCPASGRDYRIVDAAKE